MKIDKGNKILKMKLVDCCKRESAGLLNNSSY